MGMRNHIDPYGGLNPLVDRVLGPKAYDIVKFVACRMPFIEKVAAEPWSRLRLVGKMVGPVTSLLFPPMVQLANVMDSVIWLIDPLTGARYNADSGYFTVAHTQLGVTISMKDEAPVALQTADVLWFLTAAEVRYVPVA
ncbi:hypothetical protein [Xanthomonas virus PB119]|nr:hypothetical protein [Xanthomonas virus PB119]